MIDDSLEELIVECLVKLGSLSLFGPAQTVPELALDLIVIAQALWRPRIA